MIKKKGRMLLDGIPLLFIQGSWLLHNRIRDAHLSDIVHGSRIENQLSFSRSESNTECQGLGVMANSMDMRPRFFVLVPGSQSKPHDGIGVSFFQPTMNGGMGVAIQIASKGNRYR